MSSWRIANVRDGENVVENKHGDFTRILLMFFLVTYSGILRRILCEYFGIVWIVVWMLPDT